jgi:hypothetical protein
MSDRYKPQAGDRVRVVLEGKVRKQPLNGQFIVGEAGQANHIIPSAAHVVSVELVGPATPPVEEFGPGDTVRAKVAGYVYTIGSNGYYDHRARRVWTPTTFTSEGYERVELVEKPF